jgi:hypothetical protein
VRDEPPASVHQMDVEMKAVATDLELIDLPRPLRDPMIDLEVPVEAAATNTRSATAKKKTPT